MADKKVNSAVRIVSTREGFRRAGKSHPASEVVHPPGTFTQAEIEQLLEEPKLAARVLTDDEYKAHQAADKKAAKEELKA